MQCFREAVGECVYATHEPNKIGLTKHRRATLKAREAARSMAAEAEVRWKGRGKTAGPAHQLLPLKSRSSENSATLRAYRGAKPRGGAYTHCSFDFWVLHRCRQPKLKLRQPQYSCKSLAATNSTARRQSGLCLINRLLQTQTTAAKNYFQTILVAGR